MKRRRIIEPSPVDETRGQTLLCFDWLCEERHILGRITSTDLQHHHESTSLTTTRKHHISKKLRQRLHLDNLANHFQHYYQKLNKCFATTISPLQKKLAVSELGTAITHPTKVLSQLMYVIILGTSYNRL